MVGFLYLKCNCIRLKTSDPNCPRFISGACILIFPGIPLQNLALYAGPLGLVILMGSYKIIGFFQIMYNGPVGSLPRNLIVTFKQYAHLHTLFYLQIK